MPAAPAVGFAAYPSREQSIKKQSKARHALLVARARRRACQARRRAGFARHMRRVGGRPRLRRPATVVLHLPQALMGERDTTRSAILGALTTLVDRLAHTSAEVKIDFSRVRTIYPGGMLLLAYLELLTEIYPGRIRAMCPRGSKAAQLINHFGFAERLKVPQAGNAPRDSSVTNWRFATGHQAEGDKIAQHIDGFAQLVGSSMPDGLYIALSEAMTNVRHHAYPEGVNTPLRMQRWWLFSSCNPPSPTKEGQLYLAFYDVGVGIPSSMRQRLETLSEKNCSAPGHISEGSWHHQWPRPGQPVAAFGDRRVTHPNRAVLSRQGFAGNERICRKYRWWTHDNRFRHGAVQLPCAQWRGGPVQV